MYFLFASSYSLLVHLSSCRLGHYTDETHLDRKVTVDQVKLSEYLFTFQNDLQKQNCDQQNTHVT